MNYLGGIRIALCLLTLAAVTNAAEKPNIVLVITDDQGQVTRQIKLEETRIAVEEGAHEIDMVISRGAFLQGEYGYEGFHLGIPVRLGAGGIKQVLELNLNAEEKAALDVSAKAVRKGVDEASQFL